jgi:hypothetical protein
VSGRKTVADPYVTDEMLGRAAVNENQIVNSVLDIIVVTRKG